MKLIKNLGLALLLVVLAAAPALAKHQHKEAWYQLKWCMQAGGETEFILSDKTRVDCLTSTHAVEFDFGPKWAEAVGQALYYGLMTGKTPGVALILERPGDEVYMERVRKIIKAYRLPVDVWEVRP